MQIADISRVSRDQSGELIGYQRPEVRQHIQEITDYLDCDEVIFPNPIIMALPSSVRFTCSRGPNVNDGFTGRAPDLGAYELGQPIPVYGPRWLKGTRPFYW